MIDLMENVVNNVYEEQTEENAWLGKRFEHIDLLKNDSVGKVGERFLNTTCEKLGIPVDYDEDKILEDGTYDILMNIKKVEVKTARLGKDGKTFQHENLREDEDCDVYAFVDITPEDLYLTFIDKKTLNFKVRHPVIGRKPHWRRKTGNQYKWDFSMSTLKKSTDAGLTLKITPDLAPEELKSFMLEHL